MTITAKSANAQKKNIKAYASGFYFLGLACIEAERESVLADYYKAAGVPKENASKTSKKAWLDEKLAHAFAQLFNGEKWRGAVLVTKKESAYQFTESENVLTNCKNLDGLQIEYGKATGKDGALRTVYMYKEFSRLVPVVIQDNGAAGKVYKVGEDGKRERVKETYKKYVSLRATDKNGSELYTLEEMIQVFLHVLGVPQALAQQAAERLQLKAAKAVTAAEQAKAIAANVAAKAKEQAAQAEEKAKAKADAAKAEQAAQSMTAAQAQEIVQAAEQAKAAEQAEKAEAKSRKRGENVRKRSNTQTKASKQLQTK
jgi:hypothetical protein